MNSGDVQPIAGVVETVLYADDLDRAIRFYRDVLGLRQMAGDQMRFQAFDSGAAGRVFLLFKRGSTRAAISVPGGVIPPHDGRGPHHIGFGISTDSYNGWLARLRNAGVAIESESRWERGGRSIYFRDPDGHLLELVTPGIWETY